MNQIETPEALTKFWQRNYYEHIIRDEDELNLVREYIVANPLQWVWDKYNPDNISDVEYTKKWSWLEGKTMLERS